MQITDDQLDFIWEDINARGITIEPLAENLVDHICCLIEAYDETDFDEAYAKALNSFGAGGLLEVEENTKLLLILKREITMKKLMFILGYTATFIISFGAISRIIPLVGGGLLMTFGIFILNFGFLPLFFYHQYKISKSPMFLIGYLGFAISAAGANVLILHLPYNGEMIFTIGMILLNVIFLPWFCVNRYRKVSNISV